MLDSIFNPQAAEEKKARDQAEARKQEAQKVYSDGVATLRDIIAPASMNVEFNFIELGGYFVRSFFVYTYPRYLYTEWLSPVLMATLRQMFLCSFTLWIAKR